MSEDEPTNQLVPVESGALALTSLADNRILSEMVGASLVLAREFAIAAIDLDALVREGKRLYCSKGYGMTAENIRAFNLFHRAAEAGHSEAQYLVYKCYSSEQGVQRDEAMELVWLRKSADSNFAEAQDQLGYCYYFGASPSGNKGVLQDYAEAAKWYRKAAEQGNAGAQDNLGRCYSHGKGVPQNDAEAVKWYRKAAEQGHAVGQTSLARFYAEGRGVPQDYVEAVKWYQKAAEQEYSSAQCNLGDCYYRGKGVPKDILQAYKWYQLAADNKDLFAKKVATELAALMSPSEFKSACALYQEFKDGHAAKQQLHA